MARPKKNKGRDMSHLSSLAHIQVDSVLPPQGRGAFDTDWKSQNEWRPFGDRLNFLRPETAQLQSGKLSILPPLQVKARERNLQRG